MQIAQKCENSPADNVVPLKSAKASETELEKDSISRIHQHVSGCIESCQHPPSGETFYPAEKRIIQAVYQFGVLLLRLYIASAHRRVDYEPWLEEGTYYLNKVLRYRTIKTFFGEVSYGRYYLAHKAGGGLYPLDKALALTRDGFSPQVISLAVLLTTRMSFSAARNVFLRFCLWAPSTEATERLVLGLGRQASPYMAASHDRYTDDGDVLVIEIDGKATPTATDEELKKRRGKRAKKTTCRCGCQRHRGACQRKKSTRRQRRAKGDKSKNGRSITLVAMYTLKRGEDGLLHGPINKKLWGSYRARKDMMKWAREQALLRGFDPATNPNIHIAMDGEKTFYQRLSRAFKKASFVLDIRHLEEKIWEVGRTFHPEDSDALAQWVEAHRTRVYAGQAAQLLKTFKTLLGTLSKTAKRDENKRDKLSKLIYYMKIRLPMMRYKHYKENDLPIATGVIEGAARYVVGERMDCSGMRWIPQKAEALLHLRCIEINREWDRFFDWAYHQWEDELAKGKDIFIRTDLGIDLGAKFDKAA